MSADRRTLGGMIRSNTGWTLGSPASCALARAVCGPTAVVRYKTIDYGHLRLRGRTYYVHVADEQGPIERTHYGLLELESLLREADPDLVAARKMLERRIAEPSDPTPIRRSFWRH